jgi:four helix bundle protein
LKRCAPSIPRFLRNGWGSVAFPWGRINNQLRRAAVSVASNIAEGYGRSTKGEYLQFLGHARGSNSEVETQIVISKGLGFGSKQMLQTTEELCSEVGRMLGALMKSQRH